MITCCGTCCAEISKTRPKNCKTSLLRGFPLKGEVKVMVWLKAIIRSSRLMHLHSYHSADISERSVKLPSKRERERETRNDSCWNCTFQPLLYYRIIIVKKISCLSADQVSAFSGHPESLSNMALKHNIKQYAVNKHVFRLREKKWRNDRRVLR